MKKIFTLFSALSLGTLGFGQVVFQSDLQSWTSGDPNGWMGTKTHTVDLAVTEVPFGGTYSASMAQLITTGTVHRRFTTQPVTVVPGNTYQIRMWCTGQQGDLRTGYFYNDGADQYTPYNSYIDVFAVTAGNLTLLTQNITVPAAAPTSGEFIISVLNTDATIGIVLDSVTIVQIPTPPVTLVSIYDIQYTTAVPAESPELGNVVTTKGVVTGVFQTSGDVDRFFIQDGDGAYNGIFVYDNTYTVAVGDSVLVTGTVQEYLTLTEIGFVSDVTILNSGNTLPTPAIVTSANAILEAYEGVLITVEDAICTSVTDGFGEWKINDGVGADLNVDDNLMPLIYNSTLGNGYDVTGVRHYSFSENVLLPRTELADIITVGYASIEENSSLSIYPNPATEVVVMNVQPNAIVRIYSMTGALVYEGIGKTTLDVSTFNAGLYQVTVTTNESTSTQKLMIK